MFAVDKSNKRNSILYDILKSEGYQSFDLLEKNIADKASGRFVYIFAPVKNLLSAEIAALSDGSIVFAGKASDGELLKSKNISFFSILNDELYLNKIAQITAEGALAIMLNLTDFSLYDTDALVLGFGRVGKAVARLLKSICKSVSVASYDKAEFHSAGVNYISYFEDSYIRNFCNYKIILNTIPAQILGSCDIKKINENTLFIDLASAPGCLKTGAQDGVKFNYYQALQVPDKIAPKTAAEELKRLIFKCLGYCAA